MPKSTTKPDKVYIIEAQNTLSSVSRFTLYFSGKTFTLDASQAKRYTYKDALRASSGSTINLLKKSGFIGAVSVVKSLNLTL